MLKEIKHNLSKQNLPTLPKTITESELNTVNPKHAVYTIP